MRIMILFTIIMLLATYSSSITITSYSFDKSSFSPGDSGELKLTITLSTSLKSGETLNGFKNIVIETPSPFIKSNSFSIGDSTENTISVSLPIYVDESTASGVYSIPVKVSGFAEISSLTGSRRAFDSSQTSVVIKVVEEPKLSIRLDNPLLSDVTTTNIIVCNEGGNAREVELTLEQNFLFSEGSLFFGEVSACSSKEAVIEAFEEGKTSMVFRVKYKNTLGEEKEKTISIPVTVDKRSTTLSLSHKNELFTNKESSIYLEIENRGNLAEEIRIKPDSQLKPIGKSEFSISSLKKGEKFLIKEKVFTDLPPGVHNVIFTIDWIEDGKQKTKGIEVPIKVSSANGVEVYLEAEPTPLTSNKESTISVIIANKASFELSGVSVSLESDAFDILEISNKKFIGSLQPDDFSSEQFKVKIKNIDGNSNAYVKVEYRDTSGNIKEESFEIPITIERPNESQDQFLLPIVGVIMVIAYLFRNKIGSILNRIK